MRAEAGILASKFFKTARGRSYKFDVPGRYAEQEFRISRILFPQLHWGVCTGQPDGLVLVCVQKRTFQKTSEQ